MEFDIAVQEQGICFFHIFRILHTENSKILGINRAIHIGQSGICKSSEAEISHRSREGNGCECRTIRKSRRTNRSQSFRKFNGCHPLTVSERSIANGLHIFSYLYILCYTQSRECPFRNVRYSVRNNYVKHIVCILGFFPFV